VFLLHPCLQFLSDLSALGYFLQPVFFLLLQNIEMIDNVSKQLFIK